ncbi:hypothetical protein BX666DRAFT_2004722 [Dichotomocladium elegans]|nr:hypothetical protein BX666DRAFT_2004722 [Dichotomocladium elegans]
MDNLLYRSFKRTRTEDEFDLPLKKPKIEPLPPTYPYSSVSIQQPQIQPLQHVSSMASSPSTSQPIRHLDPSLLKSFTISTRKNLEYEQINQFLHYIHVARYGDPEATKAEWQDNAYDEDLQMEERSAYDAINATLREAFLERHQSEQH